MSSSIVGNAGGPATQVRVVTWLALAIALVVALTVGALVGGISKTAPGARPAHAVVVPALVPAAPTMLEERTQARLKAEAARNILGFKPAN